MPLKKKIELFIANKKNSTKIKTLLKDSTLVSFLLFSFLGYLKWSSPETVSSKIFLLILIPIIIISILGYINKIKLIACKNKAKNYIERNENKIFIILKDFFLTSTIVFFILYYLNFVSCGEKKIYSDLSWLILVPIIILFILICLNLKKVYKKINLWFKKNSSKIDLVFFVSIVISLFSTVLLENSILSKPSIVMTILIYTSTILASLYLIKKHSKSRNFKEDKKIFTALCLIIVAGFIIRIYKLDFLSPAGDEYRHLLAMKHYFANGYYEYGNSHFATYLLIIVKRFFLTDSLFLFRLPFVISGTASIFLFYLIGKNIFNKTVGLIAAYLFAFMPLSVGLSQYIRGYSIELLLILIALYLFHTKKIKNYFLKIFIPIFFLYICVKLNHEPRLTGFSKIFTAYIGIFIGLKIMKYLKIRTSVKILLLSILFIIGIFRITQETSYEITFNPELRYLAIFNYFHSTTTWFTKFTPSILIFTIFLTPLLIKRSSAIVSFFFINIFTIFCFLFIFDLPRSYQIRYLFNFIPFFILFLSIGFFYLFKIISFKIKSINNFLAMFVVLLILFPPLQVILNSKSKANGSQEKNTNIVFYDNKELYKFLSERKISSSEILVTAPWFFDYYFNEPFLEDQEKSKYVKFPQNQSYEFRDRTKIFSIAGIRNELSTAEAIKTINENQQLNYIFANVPFRTNQIKFQPGFIPSNIDGIKLIKTLNTDKSFGFYIYKIQK